ncbi:DNA topoisomerase IB [Arthrobacter glacialis]|uniref:DNA topoisomerase IB n=1 Tax=Arthrobacter glacialis TaxID=1664 RepID=UPI000CD3CF84|nr:DNA topoisomerase IB [Arthrobacter glacialis]POH57833.1 DNA topoisomerase I [Arthrobacter glacialis]
MIEELRRVEPGRGGITRRRSGHGFSYWSANGRAIKSEHMLGRVRDLAIPPAWSEVWIASQTNAHIQATGVDDAGRTQYIYHPRWRDARDEEKFVRSLAFAQRLPTIRRRVSLDLKQTVDGRRRAMAAGVRLMDRAGLRVGGAAYAQENGSFGVATLQRRHVAVHGRALELAFRGKSGGAWKIRVTDELLRDYFTSIPRTPRTGPAICRAVREGRRTRWEPISDAEINNYLGDIAGHGFTAKDFRTWQGTAVAALSLSRSHRSGVPEPEAISEAVDAAATWLHNTPAIARGSYINPRVLLLFEQGVVANLKRQPDSAVLALLMD